MPAVVPFFLSIFEDLHSGSAGSPRLAVELDGISEAGGVTDDTD
jgi:hypothetical protein